jgi:uncharacterized repeat protein (TIGR01451 family)
MIVISHPSQPEGNVCRRLLVAIAAVSCITPIAVHAVGTPAGTAIENTATVEFTIAGTAASVNSNTSTLAVAEIIDVSVTLLSPTASATAGSSDIPLVFLLTNTGNSSEAFVLSGDSVLTGDDFDPVPSSPFIYLDTDGSGDLSGPDTIYVPGSNDPLLDADASIGIIVLNDMPPGLADGLTGRSELSVAAATGTGAAGTVFAGQGTGGVDAVLGNNGGQGSIFGEYIIGDITVSAVKSQTVSDPFGGTQPVPGAEITYQIIVTAAGGGTAAGAVFSDTIPAETTYLAGSLSLNSGALTDAADIDAGTFTTSPAPTVAVALGDLTSGSGPQTIEFTVTID